jgi:hypothetical protein
MANTLKALRRNACEAKKQNREYTLYVPLGISRACQNCDCRNFDDSSGAQMCSARRQILLQKEGLKQALFGSTAALSDVLRHKAWTAKKERSRASPLCSTT